MNRCKLGEWSWQREGTPNRGDAQEEVKEDVTVVENYKNLVWLRH